MGLERKSPQSPRIQPTEGVPKPSLSQTLRARKDKTQKVEIFIFLTGSLHWDQIVDKNTNCTLKKTKVQVL